MRIGFDNEKYITMQADRIHQRISEFGGKLYLEFGGKLLDDNHASRILPGFAPDAKAQMLQQLAHEVAVLLGAEYPELVEKSALIDGILTAEEERFGAMLDAGESKLTAELCAIL